MAQRRFERHGNRCRPDIDDSHECSGGSQYIKVQTVNYNPAHEQISTQAGRNGNRRSGVRRTASHRCRTASGLCGYRRRRGQQRRLRTGEGGAARGAERIRQLRSSDRRRRRAGRACGDAEPSALSGHLGGPRTRQTRDFRQTAGCRFRGIESTRRTGAEGRCGGGAAVQGPPRAGRSRGRVPLRRRQLHPGGTGDQGLDGPLLRRGRRRRGARACWPPRHGDQVT